MVGRAFINGEDFAGNRQQDAPQFLEALLNLMAGQLDNRSKVRQQSLMEPTLMWETSCPTVGNECGTTTNYQQDKMLIVPVEDCNTLRECMAKLLMEENIQRQNACETCGAMEVERVGSIHSVSEVLIIQLKRMLHNPVDEDNPIKLGHRVTVPMEYRPKAGQPPYILTGAVEHVGNDARSGHYQCITRDVRRNCYYLISDTQVTQLTSEEEAMKHINLSYLLIFCREDCLQQQLVGTAGDYMLGVTSIQVNTNIFTYVL